MAVSPAREKQASVADRRPATLLVQRAVHAPPVASMQAMQQRVGDRGMLALLARNGSGDAGPVAGLRVSSPSDVAEREAASTATAVMQMPAPGAVRSSQAPAIQRAPAPGGAPMAGAPTATPNVRTAIAQSMNGGAPMASSVRGFMEPRFGANFSQVRVHTGERAAGLSTQLNAKAFTVGSHIFFGRNQYQPDRPEGRELIAHELTHTVQQGGATQQTIQRAPSSPPSYWDRASAALGDAAGTVADAAGAVVDAATPSPGTLVMLAVRQVAPTLEPIISGGPMGFLEWIRGHAVAAVEGVFNTMMAPVYTIAGVSAGLTARVAPVIAGLQSAGAQIAKNDCGPIRDAADKIEKAALSLITPVVEILQPVVKAIEDFLSGVWNTIGAPIWDWIKRYAAFQWDMLQKMVGYLVKAGKWLYEANVSFYSAAWGWLSEKLGLSGGSEEGGIWNWIKGKLSEVWEGVKARLAPFSKQLTVIGATVAGVLLALSPVGPIVAVAGAVAGAVQGLRWIAANWGKGNILATARVYVQQTLIPPLVSSVNRLGAAFTGVVTSISGALNNFAASLAGAVGLVGGSILSFAVSAVQWIAAQAQALANWANGQLAQLGGWLNSAVVRLENLLNGVLQFLGRVADVVLDIWGLPVLLGEVIWNAVPACVRDPIVDFLGPIILRQIDLFSELVKNDEAWQKTKSDVGRIIKLVFHNHDLMGAVKETFFLILRVFNLPPALLKQVATKALAAWDVVIKKPIDFIKNAARVVGVALQHFWNNKLENLKLGLQGWLFGEIKEKNIVIPTKWNDAGQLFEFALSVLGITSEHVWELMAQKLNPETVRKLRSLLSKAAGVVTWVRDTINTTKTPLENAQGMINQAKDFGSVILTSIAEWVVEKVAEEVAIMTAAAAASAGLSEVVDVARRIYKALVTFKNWANRVLTMIDQALDNVLDIAGGNVEKVGGALYKIMQGGLPVIVAFLADQVGLGGIGAKVRQIVDGIRAQVDKAILWLIDKIKGGLEKLVGVVKAGVQALKEWWKERRDFTGADGKPHKIYFTGGEKSAKLIVESDPEAITDYLDRVGKGKGNAAKAARDARTHYDKNIAPLISKPADEQRAADLSGNITTLSGMMMKIVGAEYGELPAKQETPIFEAPHHAVMKKVNTRNVVTGSAASGDTPEWKNVIVGGELTVSKGFWKRMHMITHQIGGPGEPKNWVAAPVSVNSGTIVRGFEKNIEALVRKENASTKKNNVVWVKVTAEGFHTKYDGGPGRLYAYDAGKFVSKMRFAAGLYFPRGDDWIEDPNPVLNAVADIIPPSDELTGRAPNVNTASAAQLAAVTKTNYWFASEVLSVKGNKDFAHITDLVSRIREARIKANIQRTTEFDDYTKMFRRADEDRIIRFS